MAVTLTTDPKKPAGGGLLGRYSQASAADSAQTCATDGNGVKRVTLVTVKYSATVTKDVTITLNSGLGAAYDTLLAKIALSAADEGMWIPDADLYLGEGDALHVDAPAGGGVVTSAVVIYCEEL